MLCAQVVMCGAVQATSRTVRLHNDCSHSNLRIEPDGAVLANQSSERFGNLTISSKGLDVKLTIYAEESKKYLCFTHKWKLVGSKKFRGPMCQFYEEMSSGYSRFKSVLDKTRYIGFTKKGRPLRGAKALSLHSKCINFVKFDEKFSINDHNAEIGGGRSVDMFLLDKIMRGRVDMVATHRIRHRNHHRGPNGALRAFRRP